MRIRNMSMGSWTGAVGGLTGGARPRAGKMMRGKVSNMGFVVAGNPNNPYAGMKGTDSLVYRSIDFLKTRVNANANLLHQTMSTDVKGAYSGIRGAMGRAAIGGAVLGGGSTLASGDTNVGDIAGGALRGGLMGGAAAGAGLSAFRQYSLRSLKHNPETMGSWINSTRSNMLNGINRASNTYKNGNSSGPGPRRLLNF